MTASFRIVNTGDLTGDLIEVRAHHGPPVRICTLRIGEISHKISPPVTLVFDSWHEGEHCGEPHVEVTLPSTITDHAPTFGSWLVDALPSSSGSIAMKRLKAKAAAFIDECNEWKKEIDREYSSKRRATLVCGEEDQYHEQIRLAVSAHDSYEPHVAVNGIVAGLRFHERDAHDGFWSLHYNSPHVPAILRDMAEVGVELEVNGADYHLPSAEGADILARMRASELCQ